MREALRRDASFVLFRWQKQSVPMAGTIRSDGSLHPQSAIPYLRKCHPFPSKVPSLALENAIPSPRRCHRRRQEKLLRDKFGNEEECVPQPLGQRKQKLLVDVFAADIAEAYEAGQQGDGFMAWNT